MNTVIVDDESLYIELLSRKLHQVAPDVTIVATFNKPIDALVYLRQNQVDLIFLDVEMPDIDGALVGGASLTAQSFASIVNYNQ